MRTLCFFAANSADSSLKPRIIYKLISPTTVTAIIRVAHDGMVQKVLNSPTSFSPEVAFLVIGLRRKYYYGNKRSSLRYFYFYNLKLGSTISFNKIISQRST